MMPRLSLRDLLCCSVKDNDGEVSAIVQRQENTLSRTLQGASTTTDQQLTTNPPAEGEKKDGQKSQAAGPGDAGNSGAQDFTASSGSRKEIAIEGGALILTLAKGILGNFSFPGTDVAFDVALGIVGHVKITRDNAGTLEALRSWMAQLHSSVPSDPSDMHSDSWNHFEDFKSNIAKLLIPWAKWDEGSAVVKFILADINKGRLEELSACVSRAVDLLQVRLAGEDVRAHDRQERLLHDVNRKVDAEALQKVVDRLPKNAAYNDHREKPIDVCYGKTCGAILSAVKDWAKGSAEDRRPQVLWLSGLAGTGKSTIAKTIATWADEKGFLGSSYFFSRDVEGLSTSALLIPYIAYHISKFDNLLTEHVEKTLIGESELLGKELTAQYKKLIENPMRCVHSETKRKRMLIVVDGLDECNDPRAVGTIINLLSTLTTSNTHIRIFFSSRPEAHIRTAFEPSITLFRSVEDFVETSDIEEYLHHGLSTLGQANWPSSEEFNALVENCGKLFIYASTVIGFIRGGRALGNPVQRLKILLSKDTGKPSRDSPYKKLDNLYLNILREAIGDDGETDPEEMEQFRKVLGTISLLRNPLSISSLAKLIEKDEGSISTMMAYLGAIIIVPPPNDCDAHLRFFHPSLPDLLIDEDRCEDKRFFVHTPHQEAYLFQRCLDIIVEGLQPTGKVKETFVPVMSYACGYWAQHLEKAPLGDAHVVEKLAQFVRCHLLKWYKVAVVLRLRRGVAQYDSMEVARDWAAKSECEEKLLGFLDDTIRSIRLLHDNLPRDHYATYDATRYIWRNPRCLLGTRVAVLEDIKRWVMDVDANTPNVFWLSGLRGTGKSAIAVSIADWADEKGILGAGCFFSWRIEASEVLGTLTHELACFDSSMRKCIVEALERGNDLQSRKLEVQFKHLISDPLRSATSRSPVLLIIDGLDRCGDPEELLSLFLSRLSGDEYSHVRILVTSRPIPAICSTFEKNTDLHNLKAIDLQEVPDSDVRLDIKRYLSVELDQFYERLGLHRPEGWPDSRGLDTLASNSGNTFLYAERAVHFIADDDARNPAERLRSWLDNPADVLPALDLFYFLHFGRIENDLVDALHLRTVIATVVFLQDALTLDSLADFLQMDMTPLNVALRLIHPIIMYPINPQVPPRPFHPSLRGFLTGSKIREHREVRTNQFAVNEAEQETHMCRRCLHIMIEGLSDLPVIKKVGEAEGEAKEKLSPIMRYACRYWATHLSKADHEDKVLNETIQKFVRNNLLNWIEAMCLLDLTSDLVPSSQTAYVWFGRASSLFELSSDLVPSLPRGWAEDDEEIWMSVLLKEACQFVEDNQSAFTNSALEVYRSVLNLPEDSILRRTNNATAAERLGNVT